MTRSTRTLSLGIATLLLVAASVPLVGCGTMGVNYLVQAGRGQLSLMNRSRPIADVLKDPRTSLSLAALLSRIPEIKAYGESRGLKPTPNYVDYVALDRDAVSYVVSASEELRFQPKIWSFPIVGSFTYVGWFDRGDAEAYAAELAKEGWDVDVRGAPAFSTLGWFRDPVVSSMIGRGAKAGGSEARALGDLAEVLLHESVHTTLYVPGQSTFNESLADFVAEQLTPSYLATAQGPASAELRVYVEGLRGSERSGQFLKETYAELSAVYSGTDSDAVKREKKAKILARVDAHWQGRRRWTNASLIQYRTYGTGKAAFRGLWDACGGELRRFLAALQPLADGTLPAGQGFARAQMDEFDPVVENLTARGCPKP